MIKNVTGDILLSDAQAIAHGIAPHDHFNQGLALALRERFPSMAKDFRHFCHLENPKPGKSWFWAGPEKVVICLMTQEAAEDETAHPGKASSGHVANALKDLREMILKEKLTSIALPRLATGVGGLSWDKMEALIHQHLGDLKIPVIIYDKYVKGVKAAEGLSKAA